jgi:hypothetical protein
MTCARARERLSAWLEGDLAPAERERLRLHLEGCAGCRGELGALQRTVAQLGALPDVEPPAHLAGRVIARLRDGEGAPGRREHLAARLAGLDWRVVGASLALGALSALAVMRLAAPDPLRDAENLRAALRQGAEPVAELRIGPHFGAGAAPDPEADALAGAVGTGADALLDEALEDPSALLRHWSRLEAAPREALVERLAARAAERGDAQALARALRGIGADAESLAARLERPSPGAQAEPADASPGASF